MSELFRVAEDRVRSRNDHHQQILGFHMLAGGYQQLGDPAGDGCVDVGLHLHGFEGEQFRAAFDGMVSLHRDAGNYAGRRRWNLAGIGRICFGVSAFDNAQCAIANVDFARLAI